jgi:hypothetical protein
MVFGEFGSSDSKEVIMGWWRKFKIWQKAGVIVGGVHLILYMLILWLLDPVAVYVLGYIESPWLFILKMLGLNIGVAKYTHLVFIGIAGSFIYALLFMAVSWLLVTINRLNN